MFKSGDAYRLNYAPSILESVGRVFYRCYDFRVYRAEALRHKTDPDRSTQVGPYPAVQLKRVYSKTIYAIELAESGLCRCFKIYRSI